MPAGSELKKAYLDALNDRQREAVLHRSGPLLVFAGAGSGKTRVITHRIARMVDEGLRPDRILAVTFTNKAAREMRERIEELIGGRARGLWMGTFHAMCGRILRESGRLIGVDRNFVIYDDSDQLSMVRGILKSRGLDEKSITPRAVLSEISRAKERLMGPETYSDRAAGFFERVVSEIYPVYQSNLRKNQALDFDDMILFTVRLLRERPDARDKYQERFEQILVDEFQDVNLAQYELVRTLSGKHKNIMIVGDDDQSIYAWRGADVSLILKFAGVFEGAKVVKLERNYRSTSRILHAANEVIRHNRGRAEKRLYTEKGEGAPLTITEAGTEQDEAMLVADTILQAVRPGRRKYREFAVLYRTNAQSRVLEEAFLTMRIPHVLVGGQRFYERKEIEDMVAYMRLAANTNDDVSFRRVINVPGRGIGDTTLKRLAERAADRPLWDALADIGFQDGLRAKQRSEIRSFINAIEGARSLIDAGGTEPVLRQLLQSSGYMEALRTERSEQANNRLDNLQELVNVAAQHDATADEPGLFGFLQEIALLTDVDEIEDSADAVTLMTAHSAKGLEFPVVFMVGMEEGVFPHSRSMNTDMELEEERRLCYVGMTRAQQELHMMNATRRTTFGQSNFNAPSRFLAAIPPELATALREPMPGVDRSRRRDRAAASEPVGAEPRRRLRPPDWKPPFDVGQQVRHSKFGVGVVIACAPARDDCEVTVAFPGVTGVKKLMQKFAKLEAV
ncbi:MAG: UvrD-helicase domain-containing protein [Armatimonadetes bacterium]|nr:UvrD-helicase domain-containing protein [Armatimonadota bacterium]